MSPLSPTLRKAAVLISALDDRTADALLDQMGPQQAAKIRSALVELDDIPAAEQQAVLAEFLRQQGAPALAVAGSEDDVSLEIGDAAELAVAEQNFEATKVTSTASPLAFLAEVAPHRLARILRTEQAQAVAVVVSSLQPERAAELLEQLPAALSTDALERLAWLETPAPEVLADLARSLRQQLGPHLASASPHRESLAHREAVVAALQGRRQQRMGGEAPAPQTIIAQRYRLESTAAAAPPASLLEFDELAQLSGDALRQVFAAADPQVALLALTGADERLVGRILRTLPPRDAAVLRQRLEHPGPIRLREIDAAQRELAAIASRLIRAGQIALPQTSRFAAAV